jgi:hypothetical protein
MHGTQSGREVRRTYAGGYAHGEECGCEKKNGEKTRVKKDISAGHDDDDEKKKKEKKVAHHVWEAVSAEPVYDLHALNAARNFGQQQRMTVVAAAAAASDAFRRKVEHVELASGNCMPKREKRDEKKRKEKKNKNGVNAIHSPDTSSVCVREKWARVAESAPVHRFCAIQRTE